MGMPVAPLEEATALTWQPPSELKAYALACFNRMLPHVKTAFLRFGQRGAAR